MVSAMFKILKVEAYNVVMRNILKNINNHQILFGERLKNIDETLFFVGERLGKMQGKGQIKLSEPLLS